MGEKANWRPLRPSRRSFMTGAVKTGLAASATFSIPRFAVAQSRPPLRVGVLNSFSKVFALLGESSSRGNAVVFDAIGWEVAGRKIELIREDDEINPQTGLDKARKLVERDKVDCIIGLQASNVALAVVPYLTQTRTLTLMNAGLTAQSRPTPYTYRVAFSAWQLGAPMAKWIYENVAKEIVATASDYAFGHDVVTEFQAAFEAQGGKVLKTLFPPLGTADYSSYLSQIKQIGPPATYNFYAGADAVRFVNHYTSFGLKDSIALTGWTSLVSADVLAGVGNSAVGCLTSSMYTDTLDTPENKTFVKAYVAKNGQPPNFYSDFGHAAARVLVEALRQVDGNTADKERLIAAVEGVKFNDPRGPFSFDPATHLPIQNVYVLKTSAGAGGVISNDVIKTFAGIRDPGPK